MSDNILHYYSISISTISITVLVIVISIKLFKNNLYHSN